MQDTLLTEVAFSDLDLHESLVQGASASGFTHCTPIQAQALPELLSGRDVAGQAQTGTGKTAAYLLAAMNVLLNRESNSKKVGNNPRAIIIAPTRELAIQIHKDVLALGRETSLRFGLVYGGIDYEKQRQTLARGVDILIGTPGRIIDYFKQRVFNLDSIEVLILDEADRMFDLGFIKDIRYLLRRMPHPTDRLNMLFSATLSFRVNELAYEHMNNPQIIEIAPDRRTVDTVEQQLYHIGADEKISLLIGLFKQLQPERTLVFVNTKRGVAEVTAYLNANGFSARELSGDVIQRRRQKLIEQFTQGEVAIVVATDVAARGLHIPGVSHVVNYDLPQNAEDYVHRIGRTARAGAAGDAISLACEEHVFSLESIEEFLGHKIPVTQVSDGLLVPVEKLHIQNKHRKPRKDSRRPPRRHARR
jgi:ATP-dependent RNA helicase RhlB